MRQTETAGMPTIDTQNQDLNPRIREHWTRKQEAISNVSPSRVNRIMVESPLESGSEPPAKEERRLTRLFERGAPGDAAIFSSGKTPERRELAKRKSQYFEDVFAFRESSMSARERVHRESMVIADIRTNVIVSLKHQII